MVLGGWGLCPKVGGPETGETAADAGRPIKAAEEEVRSGNAVREKAAAKAHRCPVKALIRAECVPPAPKCKFLSQS